MDELPHYTGETPMTELAVAGAKISVVAPNVGERSYRGAVNPAPTKKPKCLPLSSLGISRPLRHWPRTVPVRYGDPALPVVEL